MGIEEVLSEVEIRVLGCLLEKEATTPENYPLTLNSLTAACNQKSNRNPVMCIGDSTVLRMVTDLGDRGLCGKHHSAGSRVVKYGHHLVHIGKFSVEEIAILAVLMLRGPQTVGELKGRTGRYCEFSDLAQVEAILESLVAREAGALVVKLPRQSGRKEPRYAHLLGGPYECVEEPDDDSMSKATVQVQAENARIASLEEQVESLKSQVADLQATFETFRSQFD